jgi:hypothetical protein
VEIYVIEMGHCVGCGRDMFMLASPVWVCERCANDRQPGSGTETRLTTRGRGFWVFFLGVFCPWYFGAMHFLFGLPWSSVITAFLATVVWTLYLTRRTNRKVQADQFRLRRERADSLKDRIGGWE